jgi:hypothetical protein
VKGAIYLLGMAMEWDWTVDLHRFKVEGVVYLLCAATALACCLLLLRGYKRSRVRLLLWCGLCFLALTAENVLLFLDRIVFPEPDTDLSLLHISAAMAAVALLLYGLIWEVK